MENLSHEVKKYTHYFLPNGEYKYFDNLSPILRDKTTIFFSKSLTKIEDDVDNKKYLEVLKGILFFGTSFDSTKFDLPTKCMIDISIKYVDCLNQHCKKNNTVMLKSNQDSVLATINQLTVILFTNDKLHREIDSVWMLFLQNIHPQIIKLIEQENSIVFLLLPN